MGVLGKETFSEGQTPVPAEVYDKLLDAEPTSMDYLELATSKTSYALLHVAGKAATLVWDSEKRASAVEKTKVKGAALAEQAQVLGRGVAAAAPGAAASVATTATELGKEGVLK